MNKLRPLIKNRWLLAGVGALSIYALVGFFLIPFLVKHYAPAIAADQIKRQASIKAVYFNPFSFKFEAKDVVLNEADGQPILALHRLRVDFELKSLFSRAWIFSDLVLEGPNIHVVMDNEGKLNLAKIADSLPPSPEPPPPPGPMPRFLLKHFALKDGAVEYTRRSTTETVSPLNLELNDISTLPDRNGVLTLDAQLEGGGAIHWDGRFALEPIQAEGDFQVQGFNVATAWKLVHERLNLAEPGGALSLSGHYRFGLNQDQVELNLAKLGLKLAKLRLALVGAAEPMLVLDTVQVDGAEFDLGQHSVKLPANLIEKGQIKVAVDPQGGMNWQGILKPIPETSPPPAIPTVQPAVKSTTEATPWRVEVGAFKLADIGIAYADAGSQVPFAASLGSLGLDWAATAEVGAGEPKVMVHGIKLAIRDIKIAETGPQAAPDPLFTLGHFQLDGGEVDLAQRSVKLPSWLIEKGQVQVAVDAQGGLNWQHLAKPQAPGQPAEAPAQDAPPQAPWRLELGAFKLAELGIRYADGSHKRPFVASIGGIGLDLAATAEVGAGEPKAQMQGLNLALKDIRLNDGGKTPPLGWDSLEVGGGRLDLEKREVGVDKITLKGGGVQIRRRADGGIDLAELFAPRAGTPATAPPPANKGKAAAPPQPWHIALKSFGLQGFRLAYNDASFAPALGYDADSIDLSLNNLSYPGKNPLGYDAKIKLKQGGTLAVAGKASPMGDSADATVQADRLNLTPLQPVVAQFAKLKLDSADFSTKLQVGFRQNPSGPAIKATGTLGVDRLLLKETAGGDRLISWKTLAVNGIDFGLQPDHLNIKDVRILEPGAKVAIAKDKSNNFAAAFKAQPEAKPTPAKAAATAAPPPAAKPGKTAAPAAAKPFPVKVERVRLDNGVIDFSDMSLVIPFATRVHDFDGAATDISTAPNSRTALQFAGRVEEFGEAKVDGALIPSAFKTYSDVKVVFRNVEMSSLSPYSATFAGRKITSGKLSLDLLYKIENGQLKSENKVLLDQFTLGEEVESPGAVSLPLDLAIALLKDGEGKINATVPIEGDVDNPSFAIGPLIWDAFVTLVKTAVTAPFRAMGSLLGLAADEDLGTVLFPPGSAVVPPPEREKLQKVVKALAQRPQVKLTVGGGIDPKLDGGALRSLRVRRAVVRVLGQEDADAEGDPGPLSFSDAKTQKALEDLAVARGGANFLDATQAEFEKTAGRKPARARGMKSLLGQASEDVAFYEQAYQKLVEAEPLPANALETLADQRAKAVLKELSGQAGFDPGRVALGKTQSVSEGKDGNVPTKLELEAKE